MNKIVTTASLSAPDRLVEAADAAFQKAGAIPIAIGDVALEAGVSRALVYSRFATPEGIINAVLERHVERLAASNIRKHCETGPFLDAVKPVLIAYFRHLRDHGGLVYAVNQDRFMMGKLSRRYRRFRDGALKRLARMAMKELKLPIHVALAHVVILSTLAEEGARQARKRPHESELAERLILKTATSMIESLRPGA